MPKKLQETATGWGIAILRMTLGFIFIREGSAKLLGWFGGGGFAAACEYFTGLGIPFPAVATFLISAVEFLGGLLLFFGLFTRVAVIPLAITMFAAIFTAHIGGGSSYPILIIAVCAALFHTGSGSWSLDRSVSS